MLVIGPFVAGGTRSPDFPTTAGAFDTSANGAFDGFVTRVNASGSALLYSTFLGGSDMESAGSIAIDAAGNAYVTLGVEMHRTAVGHDLAAALRRRRIDDGSPIRIAEELQRHLIPPFVDRFPSGRLRARSLRVIRAFEFMIACGVLEQFVKRRRMVVHGSELDLDDALIRVQLELGTQLQPGHAIVVDVHKVQTRQWNRNLHALLRMAIAVAQ